MVIVAKVTFAVVATSCPIAISFAFTVIPVPCPTAKVLSDANVPPPVKPSPAIKSLACKVSILPSSVVILVEKLALGVVNEPEILEAICAELDISVFVNSDSAVVILVEKLALGVVNEPLIFDAI